MSEEIDDMIRHRRSALQIDPHTPDASSAASKNAVWGLALSGGGIRSATFCFGLLQALAKQGLLLRFDLLSTVSGGGYIGAMLGRLFQRASGPADVRRIVAAMANGSDSWFAWWLRANGRYLVPLGVKDRLFALAVYVRNLLGIHLELGLAGLLLGVVLATLDVLAWGALAHAAGNWSPAFQFAREWIVWFPTPWLLVAPLIYAALALCWAFWVVPWFPSGRLVLAGGSWILALAVAQLVWHPEQVLGLTWAKENGSWTVLAQVAIAIACVWLAALPISLAAWTQASWTNVPAPASGGPAQDSALIHAQDAARNALTKWLAWCLRSIGWVVVIGLLDRVAWWLAFERQSWVNAGYALAIIAAILRVILAPASGLRQAAVGSGSLMTGLSLLGRVLTFALFTWWVAVVHITALAEIFQKGLVSFQAAWLPIAVITAGVIVYMLFTGMDIRFLNLSSLHGFYRARLVRSYLGASNPWRFFGNVSSPPDLGAIEPLPLAPEDHAIKFVDDVDPRDDIPMWEYAPHENGGPVHLINVCLNETRDPRGGLFNQDRRGRVVTVGPGAMLRVSRRPWERMKPRAESLTLGSWMAISGAAVSPGLGSRTRGGISSLVMFAGARLGYWWDSSARFGVKTEWRIPFIKIRGVLRETFGIFGGADARDWYLTDGGHFENTGAYALLAERAKLIFVADCGADPNYAFGDLENLVRKARIDLQAEIEFLKPDTSLGVQPVPSDAAALLRRFGSLNDLASKSGDACFALARVTYRDTDRPAYPSGMNRGEGNEGEIGYMILIKPNLCGGLPVDLFNFKADHPEFPQQSTADQFFDEAQWESYFQLGTVLGQFFSVGGIAELIDEVPRYFVRDDGSPIEKDAAGKPGSSTDAASVAVATVGSRLPARIATSALSASLGLGAAGAIGVAVWQAIDAVRASNALQVKEERAALKELADLWAKVPSGTSKESREAHISTTSALAATLARVSDTLCPNNDAGWFNRSPLAVDVLAYTLEQCNGIVEGARPAACAWLAYSADTRAEGSRASCLMAGKTLFDEGLVKDGCARYWAYDYRAHSVAKCANPRDPVQKSRREADAANRKESEVIAARPAASAASGVAPSSAQTAANDAACRGRTVSPKVYGLGSVGLAEQYVDAWSKHGLNVEATENLASLARAAGRSEPVPPRITTVRYRDDASLACAQALARIAGASGWRLDAAPKAALYGIASIDVLIVPTATSSPPPQAPASGASQVGNGPNIGPPRPPEANPEPEAPRTRPVSIVLPVCDSWGETLAVAVCATAPVPCDTATEASPQRAADPTHGPKRPKKRATSCLAPRATAGAKPPAPVTGQNSE